MKYQYSSSLPCIYCVDFFNIVVGEDSKCVQKIMHARGVLPVLNRA